MLLLKTYLAGTRKVYKKRCYNIKKLSKKKYPKKFLLENYITLFNVTNMISFRFGLKLSNKILRIVLSCKLNKLMKSQGISSRAIYYVHI